MMKKPELKRLFELQNFLHRFHYIERVVHMPEGNDRMETDTEHTFTLAITAWFLAQYFPEIDTDACIRQALVHDLVEIYAGDTFAFADAELINSKPARENAALERIEKEWTDFPEMIQAIKDYKSLSSKESCFVYALDKIMPPIVVFMAEGVTWRKHRITLERHHQDKAKKISKSPEVMKYYDEFYKLMKNNSEFFFQEGKN